MMTIPISVQKELAFAIKCTLNNWRIWLGNDELRALHVGYSCVNPEIAISLLTDNEPHLSEQGINCFSMGPLMPNVWPTAYWRLSRVNYPGTGVWYDAQHSLDWLRSQDVASEHLLEELDREFGGLLASIVTSDEILSLLSRFRKVLIPLPIRVDEFDIGNPFDYQLSELRKA